MAHHNPWIQHRTPGASASLRLFCFHHAGGAANVFRDWQRRVPSNVEVCPVQLPGHSTRWREPPATSLDELTSAATEGLLPELTRPFAFFGHSLGALLAFRIASELARRGLAGPERLFVAARRAPALSPKLHYISDLSDAEFAREMQLRYGAIPDELMNDPETLALLVPPLRADFRMHETYVHRPQPPLACGISVYGATKDPTVRAEELDGWAKETRAAFSLQLFEGDHFFIHVKGAPFERAFHDELAALARPVDGQGRAP